ncbi:MAG: pantetheine-phosphate adenylyltransferase [Alloprevotella sp.]|nr:pantetheine-phosphate adenylyltransferase [Alloprevotella sp.]
MEQKKKIAVFPGSFDPFTVGHASIVERALAMFDEIYIGIGINDQKKALQTPGERLQNIRTIYADNPRVKVESYTDLTIDFARRCGASVIVRGIRSVKDFEYERDVASMNLKLAGIDTVILFCEEQYAYVSSSVVRELMKYGKDVSEFLPKKK